VNRLTAASIPARRPRTILDVKTFQFLPKPFRPGPFPTKSKGQLIVDYALPAKIGLAVLRRFADYDTNEVLRIPKPIISDRQYNVVGLPNGDNLGNIILGGTEFHRVREEIVMCTGGLVFWACEDVYGEKYEQVLEPGTAVWMPPFILHTYVSLKDDSSLRVRCNTLFYPDDPSTADTYSEEIFRELQANCA